MSSSILENVEPSLQEYPLEAYIWGPPSYHSEYWEANPGIRPTIPGRDVHPGVANARLMESCNTVLWSDTVVCDFMRAVILENLDIFSAVLEDTWNLEGGEILPSAIPITPLTLLTMDNEIDPTPVVDATAGDRKVRLGRLISLLVLYRKIGARSTSRDYLHLITTQLYGFFSNKGYDFSKTRNTEFNMFMTDSCLTIGYLRIISAVDMFFFRFPQHPHACIRMATLTSRYFACAAYTSIGEVARKMGKTTRDLLLFVLTTPVARDVARICRAGQGMENPFGYFPYHVSMGLSTKSLYSQRQNPTLSLWIHTIGALMGSDRSINAPFPDADDLINTFETAAAVAICLESSSKIRSLSIHQQPEEVLVLMKRNNGLSDYQKEIVRKRANKWRNRTADTIGAWIYLLYG